MFFIFNDSFVVVIIWWILLSIYSKDGEEGQQLSILEQLHEHINSTISYNR